MSDATPRPALSQSTRPPELTWTAVFLGISLSVIMGAAAVYLGLRAGMTVSASIPAAVISMGILRGIMRRSSILESNLVQTAASAGESLAAGIIFTMPALLLTGVWDSFDYWTTTLIALSGGLLGVLMMIPMRQVFVIDNKELKYPEGVACAEVLKAGDTDQQGGSAGLRLITAGIIIGGVFKFLQSQCGLIRGSAEAAMVKFGRVFFFGTDISPALLAVGFIVTLPIAIEIFAGGVIGWLITIPILGVDGLESTNAVDMAVELWKTKVRYLGVGAMVVGGVSSIWTVRSGLMAAVRQLMSIMANRTGSSPSTSESKDENLSGGLLAGLGILCVLLIAGLYYRLLENDIGLTVLTTVVMLIMSFFFAAVASYIVGLVGNSNSPVSGMTITAVLGTGGLVLLFGFGGTAGIVATLGVAGVVCCVACTSGDVCNDLKTGHLVGASPKNQQIMQVIGVVAAAFVMAPVMTILHEGSLNNGQGGIGGEGLSAPQAALFASLAKGFFGKGDIPKVMVITGMAVGILILIADSILKRKESRVRLHVMPVAVGIYLPFGVAVPIVLGGIIRYLIDRRNKCEDSEQSHRGVLMTSGLIAGESLMGVVLGIAAWQSIQPFNGIGAVATFLHLSESGQERFGQLCSVGALLAIAVWVLIASRSRSKPT